MSRQNAFDLRSSGDLLADRRFAYARACLAEGDAQAAIEMAEQVLDLAPRYAPAWLLLGQAREALADASGDPAARRRAVHAYSRALDIEPDDALGIGLSLAGLGAADPAGAMTPAYIRALFDGYAARFEHHLVGVLGYRGPELIVAALDALPGAPSRFGTVLDLGCGTGLMGRALRGRADRLVGVDLSPAMLARARGTGLYDRLAEAELSDFLREEPPGFADLVVAADVLIYVADLPGLLAEVARALGTGALAAFSIQSPHDPCTPIQLGKDGRYAHSDAHLREAARRSGLIVETLRPAAVRRDRGVEVPGCVAVLRMP